MMHMIFLKTGDLWWRLKFFSLALLINFGLNAPSFFESQNSQRQTPEQFVALAVCSTATMGPASQSPATSAFLISLVAPISSFSFASKSSMGLLVGEFFLDESASAVRLKSPTTVHRNLFYFYSSLQDRGPPFKI